MAIYINGKLVAGGGSGSTGGSSGSGSGGTSSSGGFVEMKTSIPVSERKDNTLYGLILQRYRG